MADPTPDTQAAIENLLGCVGAMVRAFEHMAQVSPALGGMGMLINAMNQRLVAANLALHPPAPPEAEDPPAAA